MRREAQTILDSRQAHSLRNQLHRLKRLEARKRKGRYMAEEMLQELAGLQSRSELLDRLNSTLEDCRELETRAVLAIGGLSDEELSSQDLTAQSNALTDLTLELYASNFPAFCF